MSGVDRGVAERDEEMTFAGAGGSDETHVLSGWDPFEARDVVERRGLDRRCGDVELFGCPSLCFRGDEQKRRGNSSSITTPSGAGRSVTTSVGSPCARITVAKKRRAAFVSRFAETYTSTIWPTGQPPDRRSAIAEETRERGIVIA